MKTYTTIYKALRGSHAYGTAGPNSDRDFTEIVIPDVDHVVGLQNMKGSQHIEEENDTRVITLKEFINGAISGRSIELECLFVRDSDIIECTELGSQLFVNREKLLSQKLFKSMLGFITSQKLRSFNGNKDRFDAKLGYDPKSAYHCLRVLLQAVRLKQTNILETYVDNAEWRDRLISIKNGLMDLEVINNLINAMEETFNNSWPSGLPEMPEYKFWNDVLINLTFRAWRLL
jgi:hypothetical protein